MKREAIARKGRFQFVNEIVAELRKVVWPSRREAANLTTVVIIVSVAMGLLLGLLDLVFTRLVSLLIR